MESKNKSDHSIFAKRSNQTVKLSTDTLPENQSEGTISGFMTKIKGYVNLSSTDEEANIIKQNENLGFIDKVKLNLKGAFEVEKSYTLFFVFIAVGIGLIFLSLVFLPIAWISPQKFVSLFSLGSLVTLISFVFIYGTSSYLEMLFTKSRAVFSILFILSIFLGIYFCFFNSTYYLVSLICAIVQLITLIIFTLSFIPGGRMGISFITSTLMSPVNSIMSKITGGN
jgi:hypothetical protein